MNTKALFLLLFLLLGLNDFSGRAACQDVDFTVPPNVFARYGDWEMINLGAFYIGNCI